MSTIYEHRAGGCRGPAWALFGLSALTAPSLLIIGGPTLMAGIATGSALVFGLLLVVLPNNGVRLDPTGLVIAPRVWGKAERQRVSYAEIIGAHIAISPQGDSCNLHLSDRRRIHIPPEHCPRGLTLKAELDARGVLTALR